MKKAFKITGRTYIGRVVMVNPSLTIDPYDQKENTGMVKELIVNNGYLAENPTMDVKVKFPNGKVGTYQADALCTLYPLPVILQGLEANHQSMDFMERQQIQIVISLMRIGRMEEALKVAMLTDTGQFFCTTDFQDWFEMKREQLKKIKKGNRV